MAKKKLLATALFDVYAIKLILASALLGKVLECSVGQNRIIAALWTRPPLFSLTNHLFQPSTHHFTAPPNLSPQRRLVKHLKSFNHQCELFPNSSWENLRTNNEILHSFFVDVKWFEVIPYSAQSSPLNVGCSPKSLKHLKWLTMRYDFQSYRKT